MASEQSTETLVYLDFNDKIPKEFLQNKIFIRIVDLNSPDPLIQVNDMVFKGSYGYSMGTNLFLQRTPNQDNNDNPFLTWTSNNLEVSYKQMKTIYCEKIRVLPGKTRIPENNGVIKYKFNLDYQEMLKKFENGTLNLSDMIVQCQAEESNAVLSQKPPVAPAVTEEHKNNEVEVKIQESIADNKKETIQEVELKNSYENLRKLARKPLTTKTTVESVHCEERYKKAFDYKNIECKVLERPFFSYFKEKQTKTSSDFVDIQTCLRRKLLKPSSDFPRILNSEEEKVVLKIENLELLDLEIRHSLFSYYVEQMDKQVKSNTPEENNIKDIYGNTPLETLEVYKNLTSALETKIYAPARSS